MDNLKCIEIEDFHWKFKTILGWNIRSGFVFKLNSFEVTAIERKANSKMINKTINHFNRLLTFYHPWGMYVEPDTYPRSSHMRNKNKKLDISVKVQKSTMETLRIFYFSLKELNWTTVKFRGSTTSKFQIWNLFVIKCTNVIISTFFCLRTLILEIGTEGNYFSYGSLCLKKRDWDSRALFIFHIWTIRRSVSSRYNPHPIDGTVANS